MSSQVACFGSRSDGETQNDYEQVSDLFHKAKLVGILGYWNAVGFTD